MLRIGVDIDGTIEQTQRAAVEIFNKKLHREVRLEDVRTFHLDEAYGLEKKESKKLWRKLEPKIYSLGVPLEHAAEVLTNLNETGHLIYFITARPGFPHITKITESWLKKHRFPFNGVNLFMNMQNKAKKAKELQLDLFFEDAPDHIERFVQEGVPVVVVDAAYNRKLAYNVPRITAWRDVPELIAQMTSENRN
ncbi:5' nucleotidase, NT5C type [Numidum massiliense]|uniref:5' nucleotidase, NT5C type n=1 Tax=Numidum massiliense TaxID=1522315 RepID=UPI0006D591B3|nr:hypothetical protein [Numidum massiliense]